MSILERGQTVTELETLVTERCCACGTIFAISSSLQGYLIGNRKTFYCPNGHAQSYMGESWDAKIKRIEKERFGAREKADRMERDAKILREEVYKNNEKNKKLRAVIKKKTLRIKNGLCPHCDRSFENLQRHMTTKHSGCKSEKGYKVKKVNLP